MPGGPNMVCMCQGSTFQDCQAVNVATATAATAAALAAAGKTVKKQDAATLPKCVPLPANFTRKVPCEEDGAPAASPPPSNGTNSTN
jgi:hypothetical protein